MSNSRNREHFISNWGYDQTEHNTKIEVFLEESDCPDDGGKWGLYCTHEEGQGVLQDTNKRRLAAFKKDTNEWCPYCQKNEDLAQLIATETN